MKTMKTSVAFKQSILKFVLFVSVIALAVNAQARSFSNSPITPSFKLGSFTADLNNDKAELKWETASEINISHFIIEKSTDGINYSDAAVMFAYGSDAVKTSYSFTDKLNAQSGVVYYRLCSVDNNGKGQYSDIRIIRTGK